MTDIEIMIADLGEITTRDIAKNEKLYGLKENLKVARIGGSVSRMAKETYEVETEIGLYLMKIDLVQGITIVRKRYKNNIRNLLEDYSLKCQI